MNTDTPQGLSQMLYTLLTYDCVASHKDNTIPKLLTTPKSLAGSLSLLYIIDDLTGADNITQLVRKAPQRLNFLGVL